MGSRRQTQVAEHLAHLAAQYFARESNGLSLVTVTHADVSPDLRNVTIFISVMPRSYETEALNFARRSRSDFRDYVKHAARMQYLPFVEFELDYGEQNRQRIDDLTRDQR